MPIINSRVQDSNPAFNSLIESNSGVTVRTFTDVNPRTILKAGGEIILFSSHASKEEAIAVHEEIAAALRNPENELTNESLTCSEIFYDSPSQANN